LSFHSFIFGWFWLKVLTFGILLPKFPRGNSCYPSLSGIDSEYVAISSFDKLPCLGIGQKQEEELKRF